MSFEKKSYQKKTIPTELLDQVCYEMVYFYREKNKTNDFFLVRPDYEYWEGWSQKEIFKAIICLKSKWTPGRGQKTTILVQGICSQAINQEK